MGAPVVILGVDDTGYFGVRRVGIVEMLDFPSDAAIVHVSDPGGLRPLAVCSAPRPATV